MNDCYVRVPGRYVPPAARQALGMDSEDARVRRRVKGCLNRLAEANLMQITAEVAGLYQREGRRAVIDCVTDELLQVHTLGGK